MNAHNRILSALFVSTAAVCVLVFATACGGGGGSNGGSNSNPVTKSVQGIWKGTVTTSTGNSATFEVQYSQQGASVTGTARILTGNVYITGTGSGTVSGSNLNFSADFGVNGSYVVSAVINGNSLSGTYTHTLNGHVTDSGSFTLALQNSVITASVAGSYTGTSIVSGGVSKPLAVDIAQNGNVITTTGSSGTGISATTFTGTGAVIGNHLTFVDTDSSGGVTYMDGMVNGSTISGAAFSPGTNPGNNGVAVNSTFTITLVTGGGVDVKGIWSGTSASSTGATGTFDAQFNQNGTSVSGISRLVVAGIPHNGPITGTVTGSKFAFTADFGAYGMLVITANVSGSSMVGTYSRNVSGTTTETVTLTLSLNSSASTAYIGYGFKGLTVTANGSGATSLVVNFTQAGNALAISGTLGFLPNTTSFSGSGAIIGNHVTFVRTDTTGNVTYEDGTLNGNTISGTGFAPGSANPLNGGADVSSTFTITKLAPGG